VPDTWFEHSGTTAEHHDVVPGRGVPAPEQAADLTGTARDHDEHSATLGRYLNMFKYGCRDGKAQGPDPRSWIRTLPMSWDITESG
jgi:hypothetical protein